MLSISIIEYAVGTAAARPVEDGWHVEATFPCAGSHAHPGAAKQTPTRELQVPRRTAYPTVSHLFRKVRGGIQITRSVPPPRAYNCAPYPRRLDDMHRAGLG